MSVYKAVLSHLFSAFVAGMNQNAEVLESHLSEEATQSSLGHIRLQGPWIDGVLENGWTGTISYAKNDLGQVVLKGDLTVGTTSVDTTIATLPLGYRPNARVVIPVIHTESSEGFVGLYMNNVNGVVRVLNNFPKASGRVRLSIIFDVN